MDQEWICIKGKHDVVVSLVQRMIPASTDKGSAAMDEKEGRKRKRSSEPGDEDKTVGELHGHSNRLRRCSKYFETCLSKEWAGADIEAPLHLTLDVHTDVKYYRDCFTRMHSRKGKGISNVKHGLKLLQVASQISYFSLVEDCVRYLTSIPWSHKNETRIREFANSTFYPSDCAADLSARLGFPLLPDTERHSLLSKITESILCEHFDEAMRYEHGQGDPINSQKLFSILFQKTVAGQYQTVVENTVKHVNACVKETILEAEEHSNSNRDTGFLNVRWILRLLLKTGFATELVEYIANEFALSDMLNELPDKWERSWVQITYDMFQEVISGRVLLNTSTRYSLLENWIWILWDGADRKEDPLRKKIPTMLNTFVLTFPLETQKEIFSGWLAHFMSKDEAAPMDLSFVELRANWYGSLLEKVRSLEPLGSISCEGDTELSETDSESVSTSDNESVG